MERNYAGQYGGGYSGNGVSSPSQLVSSGRRAGTVRAQSAEEYPPNSSGSYGADPSAGAHQARYGRRASPAAYPSGSGMDMDPPRYTPSSMTAGHGGGYSGSSGGYGSGSGGGGYSSSASAGQQPMARPSRTSAPSGAASAAAPAAAGGSIANKLAGLQRLKDNAASRLVNRIPSANSRNPSSGSSASGGYVPSAMTNQQPARQLPRTNSSGHGGAGSAGGYGYGSAGASGPSSSSAGAAPGRSASVGRPPSGRSAGAAGPAAASSGYGRPPAAAAPSSYGNSGGYGGSAGGGGYSSSSSQPAAASGGARPSALSSLAQRRQPPAPAAPPTAAAEPPPAARPRPGRAAAPAPSAPPPQSYGGGGGFSGGGGGGGGFMGGSVPPGADDPGAAGPMVECPTCGRSFNEKAYQKHGKVCAKVFAQKRKPVNMAAKRLEGIPEAAKFFDLKKGVPKSEAKPAAAPAGRGGYNALDSRPVPAQKVPKWKQQSAQLRAAMAANRQVVDAKAQGKDLRSLPPAPSMPDDRVPCPHCGRKFAELAAERHIPRCKDIMAKPGRLQAGGGRGAHMRR